MAKAVLDLDTITQPDRPFITIDGKEFSLAVPEDFGLKTEAELRSVGKRIEEITSKDSPSDEDILTLSKALDSFVKMIVREIPDDVLAKLHDRSKLKIVSAFTSEAGRLRTASGQEKDPASTLV